MNVDTKAQIQDTVLCFGELFADDLAQDQSRDE
jgi:hypothetical protein